MVVSTPEGKASARILAATHAESRAAWLSSLEIPGTHGGSCLQICRHTHCILERALSVQLCDNCLLPIGYGRQYVIEGGALRHDACVLSLAPHRRALPNPAPARRHRQERQDEPDEFDQVTPDEDVHELAGLHAVAEEA